MKKLLILLLGLFVAGLAAYAVPKEEVKKPVKSFLEYVISADQTSIDVFGEVIAVQEHSDFILQVGFSPGIQVGGNVTPIIVMNPYLYANNSGFSASRHRIPMATKMRHALFWRTITNHC